MKGPLLAQYLRIKAQHRDSVLLFRLGDFYEMFFEDAKEAAGLLDLTLTARNRGAPDEVPLCGFPAHAAQPYVTRLLAAGRSVAVCEQTAGRTRGLMERDVVRVITPGTVLEEENLQPSEPSLLVAVVGDLDGFGVASLDFATGRLRVTELRGMAAVREELARLAPRELLVGPDLPPALAATWRSQGVAVQPLPAAAEAGDSLGGRAAEGLLAYVDRTYRRRPAHVGAAEPYTAAGLVMLDETTRRNLEILCTLRGERRGSLLGVLDTTVSPMGARDLREWLLYPSADAAEIGRRLDAVEWLVEHSEARTAVREAVSGVGDLARLAGRVGAGTAGPRDLRLVEAALARMGLVRDRAQGAGPALLEAQSQAIDDLPALRQAIDRTLIDDPPPHTRVPGFIRAGCDPEVDALRAAAKDGKSWLARFENEERQRTGIPSLKVRYNKVFGYYLEVTRANLHLVPDEYERKQTLVGCERFVTQALKEQEARVLGAEERLRTLEQHVFESLAGEAQRFHGSLARTARAVATVDVLAALAENAHHRHWVRPRLSEACRTTIRGGRHPVVEALQEEPFVPNDTVLDAEETQIVVLTGPNMGGKSTYLRQVALITILAHMGSFVPADDAEIGLVDRVFTRVGASDNLAAGESTFMVEMRETAHILAELTPRSLVVLDEIGRGTSTFDGISIAWAVAEHLHEVPARPRTLFATHYHELTALAAERARVRNLSVAVAEWEGDVVFLRQIVDGPAPRSYGVDVAKLAGVPPGVVARAREILTALEAGEGPAHRAPGASSDQLSLFEDPGRRVVRELASIDVDTLRPVDALTRLAELVAQARRLG